MNTYRGPADCVFPDGTTLKVSVSLQDKPGDLDEVTGILTTSHDFLPPPLLNATELRLCLSDGRERMFLVSNVVGGTDSFLELISNGDWLT